jgi:hypothetical protein
MRTVPWEPHAEHTSEGHLGFGWEGCTVKTEGCKLRFVFRSHSDPSEEKKNDRCDMTKNIIYL